MLIDNSINPLSWGKKIESARLRLHIAQSDLCEAIHMGPSTYQKLKKGLA